VPDTLGGVPAPPAPRSTRGEQTRTHILGTALRLFRDEGYEATTMRAVAAAAGVSVGNAYYYFESKDHLIQAYYDEIGKAHRAVALPRLSGSRSLAERLRIALVSHLEVSEPYHAFAGSFFKVAADPRSPLSPFSAESAPARQEAIRFFGTVVDGSSARIPAALRAELPRLLWLLHMGVILYWVHDRSAGAARTRELVDRAVPLVVKLVGLARLPGVRGALDDALSLIHALMPDDPAAVAAGSPQRRG
jgi:AcrR family transcriptional regulator